METLTFTGQLVVHTCWCGIRHAIPEELSHELKQNRNQRVYCPLGHSGVSSVHEKREADQVRERLHAEERRRQAAQDLLLHEERSHAATKGHLTRQRRRVANGVCPCCNRSFPQLERHMKSQHPDYVKP